MHELKKRSPKVCAVCPAPDKILAFVREKYLFYSDLFETTMAEQKKNILNSGSMNDLLATSRTHKDARLSLWLESLLPENNGLPPT